MAKFKVLKREEIFTDEVSVSFIKKARSLANSSRYDEVYKMAKEHLKIYPDSFLFAYYEAVYSAEQVVGFTPAQLKARYARAAGKLKLLLRRLRSVPPHFRSSVRNEYYWFSKQPYKQYLLGKEMVAKGRKSSYYSQGVGASQVAKNYALKGNKKLMLKWAKISEKAWLQFFKIDANWYNSYLFYAQALGYQERFKEMDQAFFRCAKIAGKPKNWKTTKAYRDEIVKTLEKLNKKIK